MAFRSGLVALIGKPNVGKSTLTNFIVGQKVSIVSNKPQTTRRRVLGITTTDDYQIAFVDTPGVHEPHTQLGRSMVDQARRGLMDVDAILVVVDGAHHPGEQDKEIAKIVRAHVKEKPVPVVICMNKMDQLKAENVVRHVEAYTALFGTETFMMTTATKGANVPELLDLVVNELPERAPMFDADEFTDQSSRFLSAELVREKILQATYQEIPHSVAVTIDTWEDDGDLSRINATILVEKVSQRAILIGKQGQFIKKIGTEARLDIEEMLGHRVYLELHVKVSEDWRMNPRVLHELEYDQ
jgi:GTP-binding protein Era